MKILITTSSFDVQGNNYLQNLQGAEIITNPYGRRLTEGEILQLIKQHQPTAIIAGVEPLTRKVLQAATNLKVLSRCGTGMDNVDKDACKEFGIKLLNTPDAPAESVAELALALIFAVIRKIPVADKLIRADKWKAQKGMLLAGKTVGVLGLGRIGKRVADALNALGCNIMFYDPYVEQYNGYTKANTAQIFAKANIISLHLPLTKDTREIINANTLSTMQDNAIIINTARGELINEGDLYNALKDEQIFGAALDVYQNEPYKGKLTELDNIALTAHMGSAAKETRAKMEAEAAKNMVDNL